MSGQTPVAQRRGHVRVPIAVVEIVVLTWLAHLAAGGAPPGTGHLLAVAVVVATGSVALRHQVVGLPTAVAAVLAAQLGLHVAFTHAAGHGTHPVTGLDAEMLFAHGVGTVVTALALAWQEQVLVRLGRGLVTGALPAVVPCADGRTHPDVPRRPPIGLLLGSACPRRGPPARPAPA